MLIRKKRSKQHRTCWLRCWNLVSQTIRSWLSKPFWRWLLCNDGSRWFYKRHSSLARHCPCRKCWLVTWASIRYSRTCLTWPTLETLVSMSLPTSTKSVVSLWGYEVLVGMVSFTEIASHVLVRDSKKTWLTLQTWLQAKKLYHALKIQNTCMVRLSSWTGTLLLTVQSCQGIMLKYASSLGASRSLTQKKMRFRPRSDRWNRLAMCSRCSFLDT